MSDSGGIPELKYNHPDGRMKTRLEMDQWLRSDVPKVHWLRIIASRVFGLQKQVSWDMREIVLKHWLLDEMVRRQLIVGDQLGVNTNNSNDEQELRQFTQRLAAFIQAGHAVPPQQAEGVDMNGFTPPPPPNMGQPNGQQAYPPGPPAPPPAPPGPPQQFAPPPMPPGAPQGFAPQQPQYAPQPVSPPAPPQVAPPQHNFAPPPPGAPMAGPPMAGPPPAPPQQTAPQGGRRTRGAKEGAPQMAPPAAPVPPMPGPPGAPQGFAPAPFPGAPQAPVPPPQNFAPLPPQAPQAPQQMQLPMPPPSAPQQQVAAPTVDLTPILNAVGGLQQQIQSLAAQNEALRKKVDVLSVVNTVLARAIYQKQGSPDPIGFLNELQLPIPQ